MRKNFVLGFVAFLLALALASPVATLANLQYPESQPSTQAAPAKQGKQPGGERHPVVHRAIRQLEHTKEILQKEAARDFEGHRAKAVKAIDEAIEELRKALEADKK